MPQTTVFRQAALERLSSPEQLDQMIQVTSPRGWLALLALTLLLLAATAWGFAGSIATRMTAEGLLVRAGGVHAVPAPDAGQVTALLARPGERVEPGRPLVAFQTSGARAARTVDSPMKGRVIELKAAPGQTVARGEGVALVEPLEAPLEAVLYLPLEASGQVAAGMDVQVSPAGVQPEESGYLLGRVRSVSPFPTARQAMLSVVGIPELAERFSQGGPPYTVHVDLLADPENPSGYRWSSRGTASPVESGTLCQGRIVLRVERPAALVIPLLQEKLGMTTRPARPDASGAR